MLQQTGSAEKANCTIRDPQGFELEMPKHTRLVRNRAQKKTFTANYVRSSDILERFVRLSSIQREEVILIKGYTGTSP